MYFIAYNTNHEGWSNRSFSSAHVRIGWIYISIFNPCRNVIKRPKRTPLYVLALSGTAIQLYTLTFLLCPMDHFLNNLWLFHNDCQQIKTFGILAVLFLPWNWHPESHNGTTWRGWVINGMFFFYTTVFQRVKKI